MCEGGSQFRRFVHHLVFDKLLHSLQSPFPSIVTSLPQSLGEASSQVRLLQPLDFGFFFFFVALE